MSHRPVSFDTVTRQISDTFFLVRSQLEFFRFYLMFVVAPNHFSGFKCIQLSWDVCTEWSIYQFFKQNEKQQNILCLKHHLGGPGKKLTRTRCSLWSLSLTCVFYGKQKSAFTIELNQYIYHFIILVIF